MPGDFAEFVRGRSPALLRFAYLLAGDAHLAEDLTQEALVRAHRRWRSIEGDPEPYVRKAILRHYLSWRRRLSSRELVLADLPDRPSPAHDRLAERVAQADELWATLVTLPPRQRAVIVLRYYEDLADADIAALLGCAVSSVRVHAFNALKKLRATLDPAVCEVP